MPKPLRIRTILSLVVLILCITWGIGQQRASYEKASYDTHPTAPVVTIILPTKCRPTLDRAINSLLVQTEVAWNAVILLNGRQCPKPELLQRMYSTRSHSSRLRFEAVDLNVSRNCAGEVRNHALRFVKTMWVGFLDDDDTLAPHYVDALIREQRRSSRVSLVAFRMYHSLDKIFIPAHDLNVVKRNHIGISFAHLLTNTAADNFVPSASEDFDFIYNFCHVGRRECVLSNEVLYYVKGVPRKSEKVGLRAHMQFAPISSAELRAGREMCNPPA